MIAGVLFISTPMLLWLLTQGNLAALYDASVNYPMEAIATAVPSSPVNLVGRILNGLVFVAFTLAPLLLL